MKQALALLATVAAIQGCTGADDASRWGEGAPGRRQRRSPVLQGDVFLERSSSSLATVELWSRLHNAEALAETERQVLVAQQEALQALQKEQEALAVREAKTEAIVQGKPVQWSSAAPPKTPERASSQMGSSRTQTHRITHGVELVLAGDDKECGGDKKIKCSGVNKVITFGYSTPLIGGIFTWIAVGLLMCCLAPVIRCFFETAAMVVCILQSLCVLAFVALGLTIYFAAKDD
mmetsp:Transcript_104931/g.182215  ORF Transcript_104931/g.182215 Transcript_104931/m.182215 type:complete len:234 (-) Transcript_104931:122-823(-)